MGKFLQTACVALIISMAIFVAGAFYLTHEPEYISNPSIVDPSEISAFKSNITKKPVNTKGMFSRVMAGSFRLLNPENYQKIEVLIALYDKDRLFLTEYAASKENIVRKDDLISFEISPIEPNDMFDVSHYGYIIQGE